MQESFFYNFSSCILLRFAENYFTSWVKLYWIYQPKIFLRDQLNFIIHSGKVMYIYDLKRGLFCWSWHSKTGSKELLFPHSREHSFSSGAAAHYKYVLLKGVKEKVYTNKASSWLLSTCKQTQITETIQNQGLKVHCFLCLRKSALPWWCLPFLSSVVAGGRGEEDKKRPKNNITFFCFLATCCQFKRFFQKKEGLLFLSVRVSRVLDNPKNMLASHNKQGAAQHT